MMNNAEELPHELMELTNNARVNLIRKFPVGDIVSPPGHLVLRRPDWMLSISKMLREGNFQSLTSEKILLNIFPEQMKDGIPGFLTVHCVDGTHRLVAGLHAKKWIFVRDMSDEMLEVWIEGWAAGETSGPRVRWIPLNVARDSCISDWVDVSRHPKARGPTAQIRADIANDSVRIPESHRGVRIETVLKRTLGNTDQ